jgi:ABC-type taurine transport system ATPase subunit
VRAVLAARDRHRWPHPRAIYPPRAGGGVNKQRERIARVNTKRPRGLLVDAEYRPDSFARERLVDLLVELLDVRAQSGGR